MKSTALILAGAIALSLLTLTAHARLGETRAQIEERYGPPIEQSQEFPDCWIYRKNGITIHVAFIDGKSAMERFYGMDSYQWSQYRKELGEWERHNTRGYGYHVRRSDGAVCFQKAYKVELNPQPPVPVPSPTYFEVRTQAFNAQYPLPEHQPRKAPVEKMVPPHQRKTDGF